MRWPSFRPTPVAVAVAAGALALAACSDTLVTAPIGAPSARPSFNVSGTNPLTITSGASTQYCSTQQLNGDTASAPLTFGPFLGCGAGTLDLGGNVVNVATGNATIGSALASYNPGWSAPFTGSDWIGITVTNGTPPVAGPSSDYRPNPGRYVFQEVFTIPANVTNPVLDLHVKGDNVVGVYLNGKLITAQANTDCNVAPCNWNIDTHVVDNTASDFHIGGNDTLTFRVVDLPTGYPVTAVGPVGGPAPQFGCPTRPFQANGMVGFAGGPVATSPGHVVVPGGAGTAMTNIGAANQAGCENPMGLDYAAQMSWTPAPPPPICDFITFGRLVLGSGNDKIVISGNAGGNAPDGGILGTIEISVGGTQYHVPTIESYALPASGVLFGDPFARVITGHSGTHLVELRLRDNPNPGQGEPGTQEGDAVWLKIDNTVIVPLQTLDKGNIQLHLHCRGPGE